MGDIFASGLVTNVNYGMVSYMFEEKLRAMGPSIRYDVFSYESHKTIVVDFVTHKYQVLSGLLFKERYEGNNNSDITVVLTKESKGIYNVRYLVDYIVDLYNEIKILPHNIEVLNYAN